VQNLRQKLAEMTKPITELEEGLLISATYDGDLRVAILKFYDPKAERIWLWQDTTGHKPYCYTKLDRTELSVIRGRKDVIGITDVEKLDLLSDQTVKVRKIVTTDPLAIGGGKESVRDQITAWEADIKYYENYTYDRGLRMGTYYRVSNGTMVPLRHEVPERVAHSLEEILRKNPPEFAPYIREWAELLGQPICEFRRVALDIEVANEAGRLPDPENPRQPVIAVSFVNDMERVVYLLRSGKSTEDLVGKPFKAVVFEDETELLRGVLEKIMEYPVVVTFNGDDFDLRYLKHRAEERGIADEENPIQLERVAASLKHGIHLDLYQFFRNRSIQVYAFSNKYAEHTLNGVSEGLLERSKTEFEGEIGELPLSELASYCLNDSQLTYDLTTMTSSAVIKLLLVLSRVGKMPMNDVARLGVSNWIRSMLFYEHRKLNALIPRQDELAQKGGASSQAIIKGKKYKGGLVIEPKPGAYFDVSVLDFASLYPSLIKVQNLSYETVNCPHDECRSNVVPETNSWVCTRKKGITSLVIGSLRDLRVNHYKPLARDPSLSKDERDLYGIVTQSLKVILNAAYGVTGFETFALYCLPVAEATAALGRYAITKTIQKCTELGINVLYSDTDSLYLEHPTMEQLNTVTRWAERELGVELDLEKSYRYVAFSSRKKNYFGVLPDGTPEIKGLTGKKSVHGDTPMLARVNGEANFTTVKEVFKRFVSRHHVELLTVTNSLTTCWMPISDAFEHRVKESYQVETSKGRRLVLSGDHSLYLIDSFGRLYCKATRDLSEGDVVVGAQLAPLTGGTLTLYPLNYLEGITALSGGELRSNKPHSTTGKPMPVKLPLSRDLAFLLGIFTAEGSVSRREGSRSNQITQSEEANPEVCREIEKAWTNAFCWPIKSFSGQGGSRRYYLPILHAQLFSRLCGGNSREKRVASVIFDASGEVVASYLRGLFSGDGYGDGKRINISSRSERLLEGVAHLLAYFDIDCRIRRMYVKNHGNYYQLSIVGAFSRSKFYRTIGFLQPRFKVAVRTSPLNKELLPIRTVGLIEIKKRIIRRLGLSRLRDINMHDRRRYNLSMLDKYNAVIGSLLRHANEREREALRRVGMMLNRRDVTYDEVVMIKRLPGTCTMYDFSVPAFERFVAGNLPTLLHNSQTPEFLKKTFYQALEILGGVQGPEDFERARTSIKQLLATMILRLKNKDIPIEELSFNVMIGKPTGRYDGTTPQHVKAAQLLERTGREIKAGDIISYVKTKNPPYVKPASLAKPDEVDGDKYLDYAHSMFDQMLDALDFSFDEILGATTLDLFWS